MSLKIQAAREPLSAHEAGKQAIFSSTNGGHINYWIVVGGLAGSAAASHEELTIKLKSLRQPLQELLHRARASPSLEPLLSKIPSSLMSTPTPTPTTGVPPVPPTSSVSLTTEQLQAARRLRHGVFAVTTAFLGINAMLSYREGANDYRESVRQGHAPLHPLLLLGSSRHGGLNNSLNGTKDGLIDSAPQDNLVAVRVGGPKVVSNLLKNVANYNFADKVQRTKLGARFPVPILLPPPPSSSSFGGDSRYFHGSESNIDKAYDDMAWAIELASNGGDHSCYLTAATASSRLVQAMRGGLKGTAYNASSSSSSGVPEDTSKNGSKNNSNNNSNGNGKGDRVKSRRRILIQSGEFAGSNNTRSSESSLNTAYTIAADLEAYGMSPLVVHIAFTEEVEGFQLLSKAQDSRLVIVDGREALLKPLNMWATVQSTKQLHAWREETERRLELKMREAARAAGTGGGAGVGVGGGESGDNGVVGSVGDIKESKNPSKEADAKSDREANTTTTTTTPVTHTPAPTKSSPSHTVMTTASMVRSDPPQDLGVIEFLEGIGQAVRGVGENLWHITMLSNAVLKSLAKRYWVMHVAVTTEASHMAAAMQQGVKSLRTFIVQSLSSNNEYLPSMVIYIDSPFAVTSVTPDVSEAHTSDSSADTNNVQQTTLRYLVKGLTSQGYTVRFIPQDASKGDDRFLAFKSKWGGGIHTWRRR